MDKKILIVDDNPEILDNVKTGFKNIEAGYEVICIKSGKQCLEFLKSNQTPDLILLDVVMPEMSGWDLAAEIKKNPEWSEIPLVFITAKTDSSSKSFGKIIGADYIEKPIEVDDLKKRIDKVLKK